MITAAPNLKPVRLWPATFVAGVALLGGLSELVLPDGVYAEGRPVRLWIESLGLPDLITAIASSLVRGWVTVATLVPLIGVGTMAGALLLAALNWRRMRQPHKAAVHVMLALVTATVPRAKLFAEGVYGGHVIVAALHIALAVYLYRIQHRDIAAFRTGTQVPARRANLIAGIGVAAFGALLQSALSYVGIALAVQANQFLMMQTR